MDGTGRKGFLEFLDGYEFGDFSVRIVVVKIEFAFMILVGLREG